MCSEMDRIGSGCKLRSAAEVDEGAALDVDGPATASAMTDDDAVVEGYSSEV